MNKAESKAIYLRMAYIVINAQWAILDAASAELRKVARSWTGDTPETEWRRPDEGGEG